MMRGVIFILLFLFSLSLVAASSHDGVFVGELESCFDPELDAYGNPPYLIYPTPSGLVSINAEKYYTSTVIREFTTGDEILNQDYCYNSDNAYEYHCGGTYPNGEYYPDYTNENCPSGCVGRSCAFTAADCGQDYCSTTQPNHLVDISIDIENKQCTWEVVDCGALGCSDGACNTGIFADLGNWLANVLAGGGKGADSSEVALCEDTDPDQDPFVYGSVSILGGGVYHDVCVSLVPSGDSAVQQSFCTDEGDVDSLATVCPFGCADGACIGAVAPSEVGLIVPGSADVDAPGFEDTLEDEGDGPLTPSSGEEGLPEGTPESEDECFVDEYLDSDCDGWADLLEDAFGGDADDPTVMPVDTDGDGWADVQDTDDDNDGWMDVQEDYYGSNPLDSLSTPETVDADGDGVPNSIDEDFTGAVDADGIPESEEEEDYTPPLVDSDGDGWTDLQEDMLGFDPNDSLSNPGDIDGDFINNEVDPDVDGDGLLNEEDDDIDGDGILNADDPTPYGPTSLIDSDGDGYTDAEEVVAGSDYNDPASTPETIGSNDVDGDGLDNDVDNCPNEANLDQTDSDLDDVGDACDLCPGTAADAEVDANGCAPGQNAVTVTPENTGSPSGGSGGGGSGGGGSGSFLDSCADQGGVMCASGDCEGVITTTWDSEVNGCCVSDGSLDSPRCGYSYFSPSTGTLDTISYGPCNDADGDGIGLRSVYGGDSPTETCTTLPGSLAVPFSSVLSLLVSVLVLSGFYLRRRYL